MAYVYWYRCGPTGQGIHQCSRTLRSVARRHNYIRGKPSPTRQIKNGVQLLVCAVTGLPCDESDHDTHLSAIWHVLCLDTKGLCTRFVAGKICQDFSVKVHCVQSHPPICLARIADRCNQKTPARYNVHGMELVLLIRLAFCVLKAADDAG
jgi:hypothetical protein